jgi:hypothetical protein
MDLDFDHKNVFAAFGQAAAAANNFEKSIFNLLFGAIGMDQNHPPIWKTLNDIYYKPAGNLAQRLKKKMPLPLDLEKNIETSIEKRNFLIHNFFGARINQLAAGNGLALITELNSIRDSLLSMGERLAPHVQSIIDKLRVKRGGVA